jgi:hypothetical protein
LRLDYNPPVVGVQGLDQNLTGPHVRYFEFVLPHGPLQDRLEEHHDAAQTTARHPRPVPLPRQSGDGVQVGDVFGGRLLPHRPPGVPDVEAQPVEAPHNHRLRTRYPPSLPHNEPAHLSAGTASGGGELVLARIFAVVEVLDELSVVVEDGDALVAARYEDVSLGPSQRARRDRVEDDAALRLVFVVVVGDVEADHVAVDVAREESGALGVGAEGHHEAVRGEETLRLVGFCLEGADFAVGQAADYGACGQPHDADDGRGLGEFVTDCLKKRT